MAGYFKLVDAHDDGFRVKLTAPDGTLVAVSTYYASKEEAIAGIELIREIAGTGPVVDHSRIGSPNREDVFVGLQGAAGRDVPTRRDA
ncbi:YegP family protein [Arthrobacter sp. MDT2-2]